ncbi:hypothetical protein QL285_021119 [Trifolium repens]|nr:hypothetical protein QL285_021119 [Trifolium repens]
MKILSVLIRILNSICDIITSSTPHPKTTNTKRVCRDLAGASTHTDGAVYPDPAAPTSTFFTPVQFSCSGWHYDLLVGKYEKDDHSLWDSQYPFEYVIGQIFVPEDK